LFEESSLAANFLYLLDRFVNIFFREERLPIAEGWKRSPVPINEITLGLIPLQIFEAANWTADADVCPTVTFILTGNETFVV
jgi:hypothetical protein